MPIYCYSIKLNGKCKQENDSQTKKEDLRTSQKGLCSRYLEWIKRIAEEYIYIYIFLIFSTAFAF